MTDIETLRARAESRFRPESDRHEKGSAMSLIRATEEAQRVKTERLKAQRLAREAEVPAEQPAARPKRTRRTAPA